MSKYSHCNHVRERRLSTAAKSSHNEKCWPLRQERSLNKRERQNDHDKLTRIIQRHVNEPFVEQEIDSPPHIVICWRVGRQACPKPRINVMEDPSIPIEAFAIDNLTGD